MPDIENELPDQPDGITDDIRDYPDPTRAAERVNAFIGEWGDGLISTERGEPLYARDLASLARAVLEGPTFWVQPVLEDLAPKLSWWSGRVGESPLAPEEAAALAQILIDARNAAHGLPAVAMPARAHAEALLLTGERRREYWAGFQQGRADLLRSLFEMVPGAAQPEAPELDERGREGELLEELKETVRAFSANAALWETRADGSVGPTEMARITEPNHETRKALERAWAEGYSQGATPGQPRPGNPWSAPVSGIWRARTDDQSLATLLFVEQRGEELFAAPVTVGYNYADERAVGLPATASSLGTVLTVWLGLSDRIRWGVLVSRSATVEGFDTLRSMEGLTPGIPILNLSGRRHKEREELRSAMRSFAVSSPSAPTEDDRARDEALFQDRPSNAGMYPEVTVSAELYEVLCRTYVEARRSPVPPSEDDREALAKAICAADERTLDDERRWPDPPFDANGLYDEQWKAYLPHADAALSVRRSPVAPSGDVAKRIEEEALAFVNQRHPAWHDRGVGIVQGSHFRSGFVEGAKWAALRSVATVPVHERTDPPVNRHGDRLNDDYLSPMCELALAGECVSSACCCSCHGAPSTSQGSAKLTANPVETGRLLECTVDESGGMSELEAARELLAAAYGPGEWVTVETIATLDDFGTYPEGTLVLGRWKHDDVLRPYEIVKYRLLRAVGAAHGKSEAQFEYPMRVLFRPEREES